MNDDAGKKSLERIREDLKQRTSADLIAAIERAEHRGIPGPLKNSLEWQELKRRLSSSTPP